MSLQVCILLFNFISIKVMADSPFLKLPPQIRLQIYSFSGLIRSCPITIRPGDESSGLRRDALAQRDPLKTIYCVYKMKGRGRVSYPTEKTGFDCFCPTLSLALLCICRTVYHEALPFFYRFNKFKVLGHVSTDLQFLRTLTPLAITSMTSLLIRLNCWPCPLGHDEIDLRRNECRLCWSSTVGADEVLTLMTSAGQANLAEWGELCIYMSRAIKPGSLNLTVICDSANLAVAMEVSKAMKELPILRTCTVRFGRSRNGALADLACRTMKTATTTFDPITPFRYLDLPEELRLRILSYTHLSPYGGFSPRHENIFITDNRMRPRGFPHVTPRKCCYQCNDTRDNCCCPTRHASASESCICRLIPFELLLVSKQMKQDAELVFFFENCFDLNQDPSQTSDLLSRWSSRNLMAIRRVRFIFTQQQIIDWKAQIRAQWQSLMTFIGKNLNLGNLCIMVNTEAIFDLCMERDNEEELRFVYNAYCEIAEEMATLRGLHDLHLEFTWFRGLEPLLEKRVMGEDYDSSKGHTWAKPARKYGDFHLPRWHASAWSAIEESREANVSGK